MKSIIRNILLYMLISLIFTTLILYIYDGNFDNFYVVIQGTLLFTGVAIVLEQIMMVLYTKVKIPSILRVQLIFVIALALYSLVVYMATPWLLRKIYNLPVFMVTFFPMFLGFSIWFEINFQKTTKAYNKKLNDFKKNRLNN
ncbi:hypothetical protein EZV73_02725 [Acidaminobacter sp. JC074]|uniref:hypothetical protein n=1 Tax=Acidaminobacter sp. JC074 TaxID=2530199 RepID=UPI001F0EE551|nr:hypothetical protein [Acidaminobacter sp. JC074]MCH4886461.1 hypothetical protein [Acidaminobacter sp. JC074]